MKRSIAALIAAAVFAAAAARAQPQPAEPIASPPAAGTQPATQAATQPVDPGPWKATLEGLRSEDAAERQAAHDALEKATWRDRDLLHRLADSAADGVVKGALAQRVERLDEEAAVNPPPISLDIKDASFTQMVSALGDAVHRPLIAMSSRGIGGEDGSYTLRAVDRPFPEVFLDLCKQGGASLRSDFRGLRIMPGPMIHSGVVAGPFLVCPATITYDRSTDLQAAAPADAKARDASARLMLRLIVIADPRLRIVQYGNVEMKSVTDIGDHEMFKTGNGAQNSSALNNREWYFEFAVPLDPTGMARRIASAKGILHFTVEAARRTVEVADMEKQGKTPIDLGSCKMVWNSFEIKNNIISFNANISSETPGSNPGVDVRLVDANDSPIVEENVHGGWGGGLGAASLTPPIKGTFSVTTKTKVLDVPFELKDLPLP